MALIKASGISYAKSGRSILSEVGLSIEPAQLVTIVGPNGAGKTTLLRVLAKILSPGEGTVWHRPGLRLGYVPQRLEVPSRIPMTVERFLNLPHRVRFEESQEVLAAVMMKDHAQTQIFNLSSGQFQRVVLARALLGRPELLLLDEPAAGLDQGGTATLYRMIEEIKRDLGCAVVMVSHDLHVVMSASDRVVCLNVHVCCEGTPSTVSNRAEYRALFGLGTVGSMALYRHVHDHSHFDEGE